MLRALKKITRVLSVEDDGGVEGVGDDSEGGIAGVLQSRL